jgi:hypothetical protein
VAGQAAPFFISPAPERLVTAIAANPSSAPRRITALSVVLYLLVLASTCIVVGLIWDISWHESIGRDTFWTPAHLIEQLAAVIAGLSCGWLVLKTSFRGTPEERARSVRFWRYFQGPLGAWICIWGTIMMIASAPFDNWWHNAYGLDVRILSPPHAVLALGMFAIQLGTVILAVAAQNRADGEATRYYGWIYTYCGGILLVMLATFVEENASRPNEMHRAAFYQIVGLVIPVALFGLARSSRLTWPATKLAAVYTAIVLIMIWVLQLFPAAPRLAPIYNPITHMVPPPFPLLIIIPAYIGDRLMQKYGKDSDWTLALALGAMFVLVMLVVNWFWADFLLSPYARNFLFAADQWDYGSRLGKWRYEFWNVDRNGAGRWSPLRLAKGMLYAIVIATASTRFGLWRGNVIARVRR